MREAGRRGREPLSGNRMKGYPGRERSGNIKITSNTGEPLVLISLQMRIIRVKSRY